MQLFLFRLNFTYHINFSLVLEQLIEQLNTANMIHQNLIIFKNMHLYLE